MRKFLLFIALFGAVHTIEAQRKCGVVKPTAHRVGIYTAGELNGKYLGDLYAGYIGVQRIGEKITVDPARQLDSLWRVKRACYPGNREMAALHADILATYKRGGVGITLGEFVDVADRQARRAKNDMDWAKFAKLYRLTPGRMAVVRKLSDRLGGRDFVAYGMTELMPTAQGELNLYVLELMVRNYQPAFVYSVPAVHDKYVSFGFFQFTSFAVNGKTLEGASRASLALKRNPLPGSVAKVRGELQFRAAYLFAIHNIAVMVKGLNNPQLVALNSLGAKNHDDLIQFMAAAHNGPAHARKGAKRWLDNRMRAEFFVSVTNRPVRMYAYKTKMNLAALRSHRDLSGVLYGSH